MKYGFKSIKMLIKKFPSFILEEAVSCILGVVSTLIPVYLVKIITLKYEKGAEFIEYVPSIVIGFVIMMLISVTLHCMELVKMNISRLFIAKTSEEFYKKLEEIDYDFHENPMFLNDYTRSLEEGVNNIYNVSEGSFRIIRNALTSISLLSVIASVNYLVILVAIGLGALYLLMYIRMGFLRKKQRREERQYVRASWYSNRAFTVKDGMADIKTSDIDKLLIENNEQATNKRLSIANKFWIKGTIWSYFSELSLLLLYPTIIVCIAYFTDSNSEAAEITSLTVAASTLSGLIKNLASSIGNVANVLPDCKVPFDLLNMKGLIETSKGVHIEGEFESLSVKNLVFSYQGKKNQLDDISFDIKKGEKIAIVGANGAGKTTLVKMLLRLYDPISGSIEINGKDYKEVDINDMRKIVGAVFQNIETYAVTVAENILLRTPVTDEDYKLIDDALKFSGLYDYVQTLKDGINTEVSREFDRDGAIFSGGQNQRLAIARGYAQNYQLFMLDEPSSALDPLAEAQVYNNMLELGKDKTLVFISHRLTTTVNADKIYLFEHGKIIEHGTHEELMKLNGLYRKMFISQSSKYLGEDYE